MVYEDFLIGEIQRFHNKNGRVPGHRDMMTYNGYPSFYVFVNEFGSWNNAVEAAGFKAKRKRMISEKICVVCGTEETGCWYNSDEGRICMSCYQNQNTDYMNGLLDIDSTVGFGFLCERIVANKLGLELKHDCNRTYGFGYPGYDLLQLDNEKYGRIQVKGSTPQVNDSSSLYWHFHLDHYSKCDTYIMLGFNKNKSEIMKGWIIPSKNSLVYVRNSLSIFLNPTKMGCVARRIAEFEVDVEIYNEVRHNMKKIDDCGVLKKYN